jgi:RNA polymerase sigma factor (sigma-70 family)
MSKKRDHDTCTPAPTASSTVIDGSSLPVTPEQVWPLFRDHLPFILYRCRERVASHLREDEHLLERILADVFERFAKAVQRGAVHRAGVRAWFRHVVHLAAGTHAAARRKETLRAGYADAETLAAIAVRVAPAPHEHEEEAPSFADPEQQLIAVQARAESELQTDRLRALLASVARSILSPREAQVLATATALQEQTTPEEEIAAHLEITVARLRSYLSTAKRRLERHFHEMLRTIVQIHGEKLHARLSPRELRALQAHLDGTEPTVVAKELSLSEAQLRAYADAARGKAFDLHLRTMN